MSYINLNPGSCQACYRCIRECPVKSIQFKDDNATIIENECILCGKCIEVCPHQAKFIQSELYNVQALIASGKKVIASVAPSYKAWSETSFEHLREQLLDLGFADAQETVIGASMVNHDYIRLMKEGSMPVIITSACPSVVMLIERHYPSLIGLIAPTLSPMMAHAKLIRRTQEDPHVVFIGPCISKKYEPSDILLSGYIDNVLTFDEIDSWLGAETASEPGKMKSQSDNKDSGSPLVNGLMDTSVRLYPRSRGVIDSLEAIEPFDGYLSIAIDGARDCIDMFSYLDECIRSGNMAEDKLFIEANICKGACMNGPIFKIAKKRTVFASSRLSKKAEPHDMLARDMLARDIDDIYDISLERQYLNRKPAVKEPTTDEITAILAQMGKHRPEDELNCGTCGYLTCKSKAEAVFLGKADIKMCLPFFRKKAENFSNVIIEHSPNGIVALDRDHFVVDINPMAASIYKVDESEIIGGIIPELYDDDSFDLSRQTGAPVMQNLKLNILDMEIYVEKTMVYIKEHDTFVAFIKDTSAEELHKDHIMNMRIHTADVTQNVIEKQMRVVQEIASLLGETAAETKLALNNLKETIVND
ncbi:[Fe-Fe] hydrogenase large subunit C-terminal domain-containing protein [Proteocatella sphenisci]|uniref:[Fe-Fe] hydrogenase large subunit C-terminal domain-containing protein n=1 Tax=Proteocatella sphenisci TaxID=181070 RepID=UPI0004ADF008|nr:[Fe-Fe] hydrogenase large subunit C-terminal domain-containing protein [Proteocatella sphenisci]